MAFADGYASAYRAMEMPTGARRKATRTGFFRKPGHGQLATRDGLAFNRDCTVQSISRLTGWDFEETAQKMLRKRVWHPYVGGNLAQSIRALGIDEHLEVVDHSAIMMGSSVMWHELPEGRYLVRATELGRKNGHAWTYVNGEHWNALGFQLMRLKDVTIYKYTGK